MQSIPTLALALFPRTTESPADDFLDSLELIPAGRRTSGSGNTFEPKTFFLRSISHTFWLVYLLARLTGTIGAFLPAFSLLLELVLSLLLPSRLKIKKG